MKGEWRKLHDGELHNFYPSLTLDFLSKKRITLNGYVALMGERKKTIKVLIVKSEGNRQLCTRVGTLIVATIYLQLIQNRYMFRSFTVLQCSHQHCVQTVTSDVEVVGYL